MDQDPIQLELQYQRAFDELSKYLTGRLQVLADVSALKELRSMAENVNGPLEVLLV